VLVSHDFRLIGQVCNEILEVTKDQSIRRWPHSIAAYKKHLKEQHEALCKRTDLA
jgi:ATP-binding cassette subfamily F protein 2